MRDRTQPAWGRPSLGPRFYLYQPQAEFHEITALGKWWPGALLQAAGERHVRIAARGKRFGQDNAPMAQTGVTSGGVQCATT